MPPVFDRSSPDPHPYDEALASWRADPDQGIRAMARNLMHDHRVTPEREARFDRLGGEPRTAVALKSAVDHYFYTHIRGERYPDYVFREHNEPNILTLNAPGQGGIHPDTALVRLLDLSGLSRVLGWGRQNGFWDLAGFPPFEDETRVLSWLTRRLRSKPRAFVQLALSVMNKHNEKYPFQPAWCTTWADFEPFLSQGPERWAEVVGLSGYRNKTPHWIIALKYRVRDAGMVCRPTQLDAGWSECHFPSPPCIEPRRGGHAMDLSASAPSFGLLPELIHAAIPHTIEHFDAAGLLCKLWRPERDFDLSARRAAHHARLAAEYGDGPVLSWMPDPS